MSSLQTAIEIAFEAHKDQIGKNGEPYYRHLIRMKDRGLNETERICGVLHDLVNNSDWTFEMLEKEGFSEEVIKVLKLLAKESELENYNSYIDKIIQNKTAIYVKLNELRDKLDLTLNNQINEEDLVGLNIYIHAYNRLINEVKIILY